MTGTSNTAGIPTPLAEGHSIIRPPLFNGSNYSFWKVRMRKFIQSIDRQRIVKGPEIPLELHADALNILHCALDVTEYNRISSCTSVKEVWDKLKVTYEGTNQVKESKANRLVREYELFEMKPGETISEMSIRFTDLVNVLKALEKEFTEEELVNKVLRSLPKSWETKVTVIFDTKDFSKFTYDELIGSLITHEMLYDKSKSNVDDENKRRGIPLKSNQEDELRKTIAFKVASSDSSNSSSDEYDLAMITKRFKKAFKKGGETSKDQSEIKCFECNKPGHIKPNYPKLKKKNSKDKSKKALVAGWMDSDDSSSDNSSDKEVARICLMALEEDKPESSQQREINTEVNNYDSLSIEDYEDAFSKFACSRHMTGDKEKFSNLTLKSGGHVRFSDKGQAYIIRSGSIGKNPSIKDVALVEGLKFNLLSIRSLLDDRRLFIAPKSENVYLLDLNVIENENERYLVSLEEDSLLWHRRLGHGYSMHSKAFRVFNRRTLLVEETIHVVFDETNKFLERKIICDDDELGKIFGRKRDETQKQQSQPVDKPQSAIGNDVVHDNANEKDQEGDQEVLPNIELMNHIMVTYLKNGDITEIIQRST
ncbi:uncharacterized protein LOC131172979 [Hevea brasiliensis]|uniref:uncharacterized protein LOC131172979 n=1 Tax=Hevea brasiliensis TaxID=3981 RepID=UPI0025E50D4E|nr:uncharacterized protein LOC131172979 [Hevea brasiliensis]